MVLEIKTKVFVQIQQEPLTNTQSAVILAIIGDTNKGKNNFNTLLALTPLKADILD